MTKLEREFDISRDPSDYDPTDHIHQRVKERTMVDYDVIGEAIEEGEIVEVNENFDKDDSRHNAVIHHDWLFSTFEVVVGIEDQKVQTAMELES